MTTEVKSEKFGMFGYLDMHTAVRRHIDNYLEKLYINSAEDLAAVKKLQDEFNFYWTMVEEHHKAEDFGLFPMMAGIDSIFAAEFANMTADHEEIDEIVLHIQAALAGSVAREEGAYNRVKAEVRKFRDTMYEHLAAEEAVVVPTINRNFSYEQQVALEEQVVTSMPEEHVAKMWPWIFETLNAAELASSLPQLPQAHSVKYAAWNAEYKRNYSFN